MIFADNLVLNGVRNETTMDKNKYFLIYKPPKMENIQCEIKKFKQKAQIMISELIHLHHNII